METIIDARPVVSTADLGTSPERDITEIVAGFLKLGRTAFRDGAGRRTLERIR